MKVSAFECSSTIVLLALSACSTPIHKRDSFNDRTGVQTLSIDAKQRLVIIAPGLNPTLSVTCAEPSPDALSALSTSVGGGLQDPKVAANFAAAQVESAASIGLRTQSIQLLRDGMYRLCEQYAAGAMQADDWVREQRRYQNLMLSLLAIEQLTGAVTPRQLGLGSGTASGSVGDKADEAAGNLAKGNADVASAQSGFKKAQDTQTSDQKACASDKTSPSCGDAADDATAFKNAQTALDQATENQKTAKQALQAARGAVTTNASGAKVAFSDAATARPLTDASARYISEATRSIVTTTLLASFAQEECTRVWNFLDRIPIDKISDFWTADDSTTQKQSSVTSADLINSGEVKPDALTSLKVELIQLAKNCQSNEKQLLGQPAMFAPQYGADSVPALQVLGGQGGVTLELKQAASFIIIGGIRPYHVSGLTPDLAKELKATIPPPVDGVVYSLALERPDGASKSSGSVTISVADSSNEHVDIAVDFSKPAERPLDTKPSRAAKVTNVTSKNGEILVTLTAPTLGIVKGYTAKATNQAKGSTEVLQADGAADAKEIDIPKCTDGARYSISLEVTSTTGNITTVRFSKPVKCSVAASHSVPSTTVPIAPTSVVAKAQAGGKILVTFAAAEPGGGPSITGYTAAAAPVTKDGKQDKGKPTIKGSTPDRKVAPITLSGCAAGTNYIATVVAAAGKLPSQPGTSNTVACTK